MATDFHNFAYPDDPIVTGFFMDSGSAILGQEQVIRDPSGSNFTYVASHLGCGSLNASAELSCMRKVPVYDIVTFMGQYKDNTSDISPHQAPMSFNPTVDGRLVFGNYTERYELGAYAKRPAIYSTCANEYGALVSVLGLPYPSPTLLRLPPDQQAIINNATLQGFLCPAMISSAFREKDNATTYRFLYGGNFTNVSPLPYLGPYHSADLAMLFGSFKDFNGPGPQLQYKTSDLMQDLLLAFMKDPYNGPSNMGWPKHTTGQMLLFGADGKASQKVSIDGVDAACTGKGPYNPYP